MDKKRIALIIAFILSVVAIASLLYYVFFRSLLGVQPDNANQINVNGVFPDITNGNISILDNTNRDIDPL